MLEADLAGSPDVVPEGPGVLYQWFDVGTHSDVEHITWRELRDHGVTLRGKDLRDVTIWSDDAALHSSTLENLDTYWRRGGLPAPRRDRRGGAARARAS